MSATGALKSDQVVRNGVALAVFFVGLAATLGLRAQSADSPATRLLPVGDGTRNTENPAWSTDPTDPFPMPPELANVRLQKQSDAAIRAKSVGCIGCHNTVGDPHGKETVRLGCTDCHGGNAGTDQKDRAHVRPAHPEAWPTAANPVRSYTLLNFESPDFIRFVNPGDLRIAHISCGTAGCHPKEVQTNRKQIMTTGAMLWGQPFTTTAPSRSSGPGSARPTDVRGRAAG